MSREALSFPAYMPFLLFSKEGIRVKLAFTKMHGCGNNYIYFNCFDPVSYTHLTLPTT